MEHSNSYQINLLNCQPIKKLHSIVKEVRKDQNNQNNQIFLIYLLNLSLHLDIKKETLMISKFCKNLIYF